MKSKTLLISALCLILLPLNLFSSENYQDNWPGWRGPDCNGVARGNPPIEWSESKNIKWKIPIPGLGQSTPIIWDNQLFITTAIELDKVASDEDIKKMKKNTSTLGRITFQSKTTEKMQRFVVYAIDKNTGKINWQKTVREQFPHQGIHRTGSHAAASCVTDGKYLIASFGSFGIYCFDLAGNSLWEKDFGDMDVNLAMGEGTSPVIYKDKVVILWDHMEQSKIYVLDKLTGEILWQKDRDEISTWATPIVVSVKDMEQIIVPGKIKSIGYNLKNGDEIWSLSGLQDDIIPSPVFDGERVFLMTGFMGRNKILQAVDLMEAKGKLDSTDALVWTHFGNTPYVQSPLLSEGKLYFIENTRAKLTCIDAETGKIYYKSQKLEGMKNFYASPTAANDNVYLVDRKGNCIVFKEGDAFRPVAMNKLADTFDASPVIVGDNLYLRGWKSLYCIGN